MATTKEERAAIDAKVLKALGRGATPRPSTTSRTNRSDLPPRPCAHCGAETGGWDDVAGDWWPVDHAAGCRSTPRRRAIAPRSTFA